MSNPNSAGSQDKNQTESATPSGAWHKKFLEMQARIREQNDTISDLVRKLAKAERQLKERKEKKLDTILIPNALYAKTDLSWGAKCLWGLVESYCQTDEHLCWTRKKVLARKMRVTSWRIRQWMAMLEKHHLLVMNADIHIDDKGRQWPGCRTVHPTKVAMNQEDEAMYAELERRGSKRSPQGDRKESPSARIREGLETSPLGARKESKEGLERSPKGARNESGKRRVGKRVEEEGVEPSTRSRGPADRPRGSKPDTAGPAAGNGDGKTYTQPDQSDQNWVGPPPPKSNGHGPEFQESARMTFEDIGKDDPIYN